MGFLDALRKGIDVAANELTKPKEHSVGERFEDYIEKKFTAIGFKVTHRTPSYAENKIEYDEKSLLPDLRFSHPDSTLEFYVECKFRTTIDVKSNRLEWCKNENQLERYKSTNQTKPVFIAVGLGASPKQPDTIYIIPVWEIEYTGLFMSFLQKYKISESDHLPTYIQNFLGEYEKFTVPKFGYCIRTGKRIPFDPKRPFSEEAYKFWAKYKNPNYQEQYCHRTGKPSNGRTSFAKPILE